jgi:hypothetical protein
MTDNQMDSGDPVGTPNPQGSDSDSSKEAAKLSSVLDSFAKKLEEIDGRTKALQGDKDRGVNKTRKEVEQLKQQMAEIERLKKAGFGEDEAFEELSFRQELSEVKEALKNFGSARTQTAGNGEGEGVDVAKVFGERGLDLKDPQVALEVSKKYGSPAEAELAAYKLRDRLAANPTHNPAQDVAIVGKQPSPQSVDALTKQYQLDMIAARGKPDAIRQIKENARKNGVPVDSVTFV